MTMGNFEGRLKTALDFRERTKIQRGKFKAQEAERKAAGQAARTAEFTDPLGGGILPIVGVALLALAIIGVFARRRKGRR